MQPAQHPLQQSRLEALHDLEILDTPRDEVFDGLVQLAADICEAPMAALSLVAEKRQWFKAEVGLGLRETPIDLSICAHAILSSGTTVIEDTLADPRSCDNSLCSDVLCADMPGVRFYAGVPLVTEDGLPIGALCVLDRRPRRLDARGRRMLERLAVQAMHQIVAQRDARLARDLAQEVDHRVKNSLALVSGLLSLQARQTDDPRLAEALAQARDRIGAVAHTHDLLHRTAAVRDADLGLFVERLFESLAGQTDGRVALVDETPNIAVGASAMTNLGIVLNELVTNALRHGFPAPRRGTIRLTGRVEGGDLVLRLVDDGTGLPADFSFERSTGFGTALCHTLATQMGGRLDAAARPHGAAFTLRLPMSALT